MDIAIYKGKNLHEAELDIIFKPKWYKISKLSNNNYLLAYISWDMLEHISNINELVIENGLIKLYIWE